MSEPATFIADKPASFQPDAESTVPKSFQPAKDEILSNGKPWKPTYPETIGAFEKPIYDPQTSPKDAAFRLEHPWIGAVEGAGVGLAKWTATPSSIIQIGATATPAAPVIYAKWAYDMIRGGVQSVKDLTERMQGLVAAHISAKIQSANQLGHTPPPSPDKEQIQGIANDAVNSALMFLGVAGLAGHALAPKSTEALASTLKEKPNALDSQTTSVRSPLRDTPGEGTREVPAPASGPKADEGGGQAPRPEEKVVSAAIQTPQGNIVAAPTHVEAYDKAKSEVQPDTSGSKEGFVTNQGQFISREQAADMTGLPTKVEPGKLHSSDLNEAKSQVPIPELDWPNLQRPHRLGVIEGVKLDQSSVPELTKARDEAYRQMQIAADAKDEATTKSEFGKGLFLSGMVEGAERKGPNYEAYAKENEAQPPSTVKPPQSPVPPSGVSQGAAEPSTTAAPVTEDVTQIGKAQVPISEGPGAASPGDVPMATQESQLMTELSKLPKGKGPEAGRITLADQLADLKTTGKDAMSKWWLRTKAGAEQYKRLLFGAPLSENDFWSTKKDWAANRQVNSGVAKEMIDQGKKLVPKSIDRQAMGKYAQALMTDDPEGILREWAASSKLAKNRAQYERAMALTEDQKQAVRQAIQYYESKGTELQKMGLLNSLIEDYAGQHMVDMKGSTPAEMNTLRADLVRGTFNTNFKYALQRMFQTEFDLEQAGYKLKTTDLFDKLANYAKTANDVLADRTAVKQWMDGETQDGKPLFATGQNRIQLEGGKNDALLVNPKVRPDPKWKNPITGDPEDISGEYVKIDHPAFKKWQWAETGKDGKQTFVQGDVWAHRSIADELKNTFGRSRLYDIPGIDTATRINAQLKGIKLVGAFHQVKTAIHAMTHLVRPFGLPKIDVHSAAVYDAMRSGLQLFETRASEMFSEGLASSSLIQKIPGLGERLKQYQEYLFHDYIPRIKMATYEAALRRNKARYPDVDENILKQITANQVNSAYGELNWKLMGINPTFQHSLRLALLAPDFQAAQHGFVAQMFTKLGGENRMSAALMIGGVYTGARILNQIFDNDPHFELKRAFSVVIGGREYGIRTIASDAQRAFTDTSAFIYHRLGSLTSAAVEFISKTDTLGRKETTRQAVKNIALRAVPMPVTPRDDLTFVESALASTFGYYEKRASAISDIHQMATDWRKKNDPKWRNEPTQYPPSDYTQLRQDLQDNRLGDAENAYKELLKKHSASEISKSINAVRPFTGSASLESKFLQSLSESDKAKYYKARQEQKDIRDRFGKMKSQLTRQPEPVSSP